MDRDQTSNVDPVIGSDPRQHLTDAPGVLSSPRPPLRTALLKITPTCLAGLKIGGDRYCSVHRRVSGSSLLNRSRVGGIPTAGFRGTLADGWVGVLAATVRINGYRLQVASRENVRRIGVRRGRGRCGRCGRSRPRTFYRGGG